MTEKLSRRLGKAPEAAAPRRTVHDYEGPQPEGVGWLLFSAIALGLAGFWTVVEGILAIGPSRVYAADAAFAYSNLETWGWGMLLLGALALYAAFAVYAGRELARWIGITAAVLGALGHLLFLDASPWWATAMFAVDLLVIYGLAVYGGHPLRTE
jgi:hypothetical protein